jgi:proteasome assembly chaperone (PAC2) family protein
MLHEKRPALAATSVPGAVTSKGSAEKYSTKTREVPLDDVLLVGRQWPLIAEGEYQVAYTHHEMAMIFNTPKVFCIFGLLSRGHILISACLVLIVPPS